MRIFFTKNRWIEVFGDFFFANITAIVSFCISQKKPCICAIASHGN